MAFTLTAVSLKMIRRSSLSDIGEEEKNVEVKGKRPSPPAISTPVLEEKSVMDCDDVLPANWRFWGVTEDGVHIADTVCSDC